MPADKIAALQRLPQVAETWQVARTRLRAWITPPGKTPYRPHLILVVNLDGPPVVLNKIVTKPPSPEQVLDLLGRAMLAPASGAGRPRRPTAVEIADEALAKSLSPELAKLGIRSVQVATPELFEVVTDLEEHIAGHKLPSGLLETPGVTPEQVGGFFAAAAFFFRQAPWRFLTDSDTLTVQFPAQEGKKYYAIVMGNAGLTYGLAVYDSWSDLQKIYQGTPPQRLARQMDARSLLYEKITTMPFADLDAMEQYDWEVADPAAYPVPVTVTRRGQVERPDMAQLAWYEAVLRAIPPFVRNHLLRGLSHLRPATATMTVPTVHGEVAVYLEYPAIPPVPSLTPRHRRR
jgi:hypothetical protein